MEACLSYVLKGYNYKISSFITFNLFNTNLECNFASQALFFFLFHVHIFICYQNKISFKLFFFPYFVFVFYFHILCLNFDLGLPFCHNLSWFLCILKKKLFSLFLCMWQNLLTKIEVVKLEVQKGMIELTNKLAKKVFTFISSNYIFLSNYFQTKSYSRIF